MTELLKMPKGLKESDPHMSNMDGRIDKGFEENLRTKEFYGQHSAWDFCGYAWFDGAKFHEEVWVYGGHIATISANSLKELMNEVNDKYGYE